MPHPAEHIQSNADRLCALLQELVRVPTVNPPGRNYAQMVDLLRAKCAALSMSTEVLDVPTEEAIRVVPHADEFPRLNLLARWDVGAARTVHFNSHYDVVPVSQGWSRDPFDPTIQGKWLYGRGSDDMKDSVAATLTAIEALQRSNVAPAFNVECSFTADEEIGGDLGAGYIAKHGHIQADYIVNCEGGTGLDIGCGHNGVLWLEITVKGKAAHASRPDNGLNAFEKMAELVLRLRGLNDAFEEPARAFVTPSGASRRPTINMGGVFGGSEGDKENTVPARATFTIDRRILPNETLKSAESELRRAIADACAAIPDLRVDVRRTLGIEPCLVDHEHPFAEAFGGAVRSVRRSPVRYNVTTGFTDLHFLVQGGKPGVGYGPRGQGAHGANERVRIADLVQTAKIYAEFMENADF
ncbi:ArgE/DapE family deacylase [Candidatus Poribacteria bacterium]|jgi:succinyl-diaminopimelate desuccinylase|nr:ArgE/DapE family deacylase [Candidatus Poribacteria bacterium]MBT5534416.1 ArgE/DapE family deacylase [Candidatus Poribacteria bacterium]MBT5709582.1 ArgE/DapE family deacylase [Candidatus Poribacteria bacterium]MBT7101098.1 ArgE/DapE family deacylase [Candidatus Poribacteria bacterium]MBT7807547.1 ArgE/DapE family deacylase [Candidatus Poribacteria bacterium]